MPRYHFNVHDGSSRLDEEGTELGGIAEARRAAAQLAGCLLKDEPDTFWTGEEWRMDVTDEQSLVLFSITFVAIDAPCLSYQGSAIYERP